MADLMAVDEVCEEKRFTVAVHPAIRKALVGFEDVFSTRAASFLKGDGSSAYFLPLKGRGDVKRVFSLRYSPGEHLVLRVDPARANGLSRIKEVVRRTVSAECQTSAVGSSSLALPVIVASTVTASKGRPHYPSSP